jgi:hypothetical protein
VSRRSTDNGLTWSAIALAIPTSEDLLEMHGWSIYNPSTHQVFLFTNDDVRGDGGCGCKVSYVTSLDGGVSWTSKVEVGDETSDGYYGMSLAHGITLVGGGGGGGGGGGAADGSMYANRMIGCMRKICRNTCGPDYASKSYYSDDNGASWKTSEWLAPGTTECQLIELSDGRLYISSRPYEGWNGTANVRLGSYSSDGGASWGETFGEDALIDYGFADEGSVASDVRNNVIVYVHPMAQDRSNLTLYKGRVDKPGDDIAWTPFVNVYGGQAEYSDVQVLNDGRTAAVLFESDSYGDVKFGLIDL